MTGFVPSLKIANAARAMGSTATVALGLFLAPVPVAFAQAPAPQQAAGQQMFVNADELIYDDVRNTVSAVGGVKLYYGAATLEADRVVYERTAGRVQAFGNVRLTDPEGNVYHSEQLELTDDLRDGFVQSLTVETAMRTRFAAARATRTGGNVTVFENGVYTACEPCANNPDKPPLWQIKAARIIHDQQKRTVYYEDASLELFGMPIAYLPYFSHADPTVKRKSGLLPPRFLSSTEYGVGIKQPVFWNIAPNMDVTFSPAILSEQGLLGDVEFRHRLENGTYTIHAAGIFQQNPGLFEEPDQQNEGRGAVRTKGDFDINEYWSWGWDLNLLSDRWVLDDYDLWGSDWSEAISTAYLEGQGDRTYFELRGYHFYGLSQDDVQDQLPIAGVWDYNYVHDKPVFGGEFSFNINLTSVHRDETDFEPLTKDIAKLSNGLDPKGSDFRSENLTCDFNVPLAMLRDDCSVAGIGGAYTRLSVDAQWRRQFIDPIGQVWTPFAYARGDFLWVDPEDNANLDNLIDTDSNALFRGMAGAGLEYRYPFVANNSFGTHIIEPIAQIILRPDEQHIGEIPNEDAQSLFFDTSNLFTWDKFSGYDRIEGGGRANIGAQYTLNMTSGGFLNVMAGQSYHLFGTNSFAEQDLLNVGENSGLETDSSDYVASAYLHVPKVVALSTRFRFDEETFDTKAIEVEARFNKGPVSGGLLYGRYDEPPLAFEDASEGVLGNLKLQLNDNVYLAAAARYNLETDKFDKTQAGIGYLDECFSFGLNYAIDWSENGNEDPVHKVYMKFALRTLGGGAASVDLSDDTEDQ